MTEPLNHARNVEIVEKTTPYQGYSRIDVYRLCHKRFGGGWTEVMSRELFDRGHAAVVLPYDPARDAVVLIEQFRIGAYAAGFPPGLIEPVAGIVEPGETPEDVVRREAVEEAGCTVGELVRIGEVMPSPGGSSERFVVFCGQVDAAGAGGIHGRADEGEDIRVVTMGLDQALAALADGRIHAANAVISLQWLALNREKLRAAWGAGG